MKDTVLSSQDKTRLTDYAREVVARNARAGAAAPAPVSTAQTADPFSNEGLRIGLIALEKEFEALRLRVEQNFSAILTALQRIETRTVQTSGEVRSMRDDVDARAGSAAYANHELMAAAKEYGSALNGEITQLVQRLDKMNEPVISSDAASKDAASKEQSTKKTFAKGSIFKGSKSPGVERDD